MPLFLLAIIRFAIFFETYLFTLILILYTFFKDALSYPTTSSYRKDGTIGQCGTEALTTTSGRYIGHCSPQHHNITEYLGIRYALPPAGDSRFAAPVPFTSEEVLQASTQPDDCPYVAQPWGSAPGEVLISCPSDHGTRVRQWL